MHVFKAFQPQARSLNQDQDQVTALGQTLSCEWTYKGIDTEDVVTEGTFVSEVEDTNSIGASGKKLDRREKELVEQMFVFFSTLVRCCCL